MGKITSRANPIRISHPPHMPRYRMGQQDKVTKLLNILRHTLGAAVSRGTELKSDKQPGWFQQKRIMKKYIATLSGNRLILIDNGCRSESQRHWFYHRDCGNNLFIAPKHIVQVGPQHVCIYCQGATDMKACGTASLLQKFVYEHSGKNVITILRQDLDFVGDGFAFYCLLHKECYASTFKNFLATASITNGCPRCREEATGLAKRPSLSITRKT